MDSVFCKCGYAECNAEPHRGKTTCSSRAASSRSGANVPEGWEELPGIGAKCPPCVKATPISYNVAGALDVPTSGLDVNETAQ